MADRRYQPNRLNYKLHSSSTTKHNYVGFLNLGGFHLADEEMPDKADLPEVLRVLDVAPQAAQRRAYPAGLGQACEAVRHRTRCALVRCLVLRGRQSGRGGHERKEQVHTGPHYRRNRRTTAAQPPQPQAHTPLAEHPARLASPASRVSPSLWCARA